MVSYDQALGVVTVPLTEESFGKRVGDKDRSTLYEEGPWFYHRGSLYYMVYAASGIPESLSYSTSKSPTGLWTYRGIIMPKGLKDLAFTNHPGIEHFKGHDYLFYHNQALPGGSGFDRSVCVEEFQYNPDGSFPTVLSTAEGPDPVAHLNPYDSIRAATIAWEAGVKTETDVKAGTYVTGIQNDAHIKVKSVDFGSKGPKRFTASIASAAAGNIIQIHIDSVDGAALGSLAVPSTGGTDTWKTVETDVSTVKGVHDLYFVFKTVPDAATFDFLQWRFLK
jgi:hypothetical protein